MSETPAPETDAALGRLVARSASGDVASFTRLYDATSAAAFAVAVRVTGDRHLAEQVLQSAFVSVWHEAERFRAKRTAALTWILAIVHRHAVATLREARPVDAGAHTPDRTAASHRALRKLPEEQEQVVSLAYFGGHSQPEIAEMTGTPLATVKARTRSALDQLRDAARPLAESIALPLTGSTPIPPPPTGAAA
ncbi:sigma factor-like helix-turn-helix DNA-binding protein [Microbacterium sp. 179-I 1D1 NHS]|uniref:sigma factor-like helix-turn-helix DNA-binding protein n=1 Tax=Microbacterium sp. 179-I 1D1 NHS TaxID=3374298 RepID=UPI0038799A01